MGRGRDFKSEYVRRIQRGLERGLSRTQATGHPVAGEHLASRVVGVESPSAPTRGPDRSQTVPPLGRLPFVAFAMACGVMVVALAYMASRVGSPWAGPTFWVGQGVLYTAPATLLLLRRPLTRVEALGVAWLVPVATYAITEAYSPIQFRFIDEFAHVRTAQSILSTHHLFAANPALAVSPQFPGLEIVTTALVSLSHLSIYAAGTVVVGVAHLLLGLGVYFLMVEVTGRRRVGALAVLIYSTQPHFQFFDSYFIYEVIALPFAVASLLAVMKMLKESDWHAGLGWGIVAVLAAAATVVSHHAASYFLLAFLVVIEVSQLLLRPQARRGWQLPAVICLTAGLIARWDLGIATATVSYFAPTIHTLIQSLTVRGHVSSVSQPSGPRFDVILEYAATALLGILFVVGLTRLWRARHRRQGPLTFAIAIASITLLAALGVRLLGSEGSALYGRAATYFMIPVSLVVVFAVRASRLRLPAVGGWQAPRMPRAPVGWLGVAAVVLLGLGGIAGGWPPSYARLPGSFRVEAWERSIDQHNLSLANWAATELTANNGVASDFVTASLLASLGHQAAPQDVAALFLTNKFSPSARTLVRDERIGFIVVDSRISRYLPESGYYFSDDPRNGDYVMPFPARDLGKFNAIPGVSRVFEDGVITVYALAGSLYTTGKHTRS